MRRSRVVGALVVLAVAAAGLALPVPARAVDRPAITSLSLSHSTVSLTRANEVALVRVRMHVVSPVPITPGIPDTWIDNTVPAPAAHFTRTSGQVGSFEGRDIRPFELVAGTAIDGDWMTTLPVTSAYRGTWQLRSVQLMSNEVSWDYDADDLPATPTLKVTAKDWFELRYTTTPRSYSAASPPKNPRVHGTVIRHRDRSPVRGLRIRACREYYECRTGYLWNGPSTTTDAKGRFTLRYQPYGQFDVSISQAFGSSRWNAVRYFESGTVLPYRLTVKVTSKGRTVRVGRTLGIVGTVGPKGFVSEGSAVRLDRRAGKRWKSVASTRISSSGRFTVALKAPSNPGTYRYRVVKSNESCAWYYGGHCGALGDTHSFSVKVER